ncbi:hypothetical protein PM082_024643 [Marasmius tenuissimus]|nr:hypothetical protein PM082_024643 [Marasmius tenuissimus]
MAGAKSPCEEQPIACEASEECNLPVDIVFQSADERQFGAHIKNLESFAEGFPLAESTTHSGIVPLGDRGETLHLFLKFTHNQPAPDLSSLDIDGLLDLAEVADKYGNHFALAACRQPMRLLADESPDNALKVLRFKAIHRDFEGIDVVAVKTINFPIIHVLKVFGQNHTQEFAVWIQYQQSWKDFTNRYLSRVQAQPIDTSECAHTSFPPNVICPITTSRRLIPLRRAMETGTPSLERFDLLAEACSTLPDSNCDPRCNAFDNWCKSVRDVLRKPPLWCNFLSF